MKRGFLSQGSRTASAVAPSPPAAPTSISAAPPELELTYLNATTPSRDSVKTKPPVRPRPEYVSPPPRNARERKAWDAPSQMMLRFHNHFKYLFKTAWDDAPTAEKNGTVRQFVNEAQQLYQYLHGHHSIEEAHFFPRLATKMPQFGSEHLDEHKAMLEGLEKYSAYLNSCKSNPSRFSATELRKVMMSFGPVLFYHLDAEVDSLRGENLRRYFTLDEVEMIMVH